MEIEKFILKGGHGEIDNVLGEIVAEVNHKHI